MAGNIKPIVDEFELVAESGVDERNRLSLTKAIAMICERLGDVGVSPKNLQFRISVNSVGQILLDPALTIPVHEVWLFRNPAALSKVREGLIQAAEGDVHDLGSFAKYADDEIE